MHQTDPLRVTFEMTQILAHLTAQIFRLSSPSRRHKIAYHTAVIAERLAYGAEGKSRCLNQSIDGGLAEMTKGRIADIVHQAGHLNDAFERPGQFIQSVGFQQTLLFETAEDLFRKCSAPTCCTSMECVNRVRTAALRSSGNTWVFLL
ncbi:hypothetical protein HR12_33625 [Microbacterium sp. SUBG005]|nr:hypothetical protein HR12_33625 [Microbacterium sp. SUBG005]